MLKDHIPIKKTYLTQTYTQKAYHLQGREGVKNRGWAATHLNLDRYSSEKETQTIKIQTGEASSFLVSAQSSLYVV